MEADCAHKLSGRCLCSTTECETGLFRQQARKTPFQALRRLFNIEGAQMFQKGTTSRSFEATYFRTRSIP